MPGPVPPAAGAPRRRRPRSERAGSSSSRPRTVRHSSKRSRSAEHRHDHRSGRGRSGAAAARAGGGAVRPQPAHPYARHRVVRGMRAGDPLAHGAPLRPAPARLFLHPGPAARGPAAGYRAYGAGVRCGGAQDLPGHARAQDRRGHRCVRAGRRVSTGPVRPRERGPGPAGRRMDPGLPAQPAGPAAGPRRSGQPTSGEDTRPDVYRRPGLPRRRHVNPLDILYGAGGGWLAAAAVGLLAASWRPGLRACCALSGLAGAAAVAGGGWSLIYGDTAVMTPGGEAAITGGPGQRQMTSLAGVFVALLGIVAVAIALYAPRYHEPGRGTAVYLAAYNLALLACLVVLAAGGMVTFLVAWETMSLTCYLLILRHARRDDVARGSFWFLALSEIGFLLVVAAFVILAGKTHATSLDAMAAAAHLVTGGWRAAAYLLALTGFGFKAGLVPLHVWLPEAHPVAPADGSAFLSGGVVKLGTDGIALFAFWLDPVGGAWPGLVTMGAGAITAAIGILYALRERDIKRFLAYSTIENTGIIVTAFGAAMIFHAYRQPALAAFLLIAGLYHVANHGCYKTLLFLEAGVVEHATGTRDMDRLGGARGPRG